MPCTAGAINAQKKEYRHKWPQPSFLLLLFPTKHTTYCTWGNANPTAVQNSSFAEKLRNSMAKTAEKSIAIFLWDPRDETFPEKLFQKNLEQNKRLHECTHLVHRAKVVGQ